jgi:predicted phage tail protein
VDGNTASRDAGIVGNVTNALANFMAFSDQRVTFAVGETKTMAEITETRKTAADATSAVAEQVTTLKATVEQNGQINAAAITRIDKAVTDLESATATSIQQVTAAIGDTNASVQTTSQAVADINGKLSAQWGVKVQVEANGVKRIAGIQLGIDGTGASNFLISADTFAVYNPTTRGQELVFASTGGQMFMRSVFIQDGSIDNGKIGNYIQSSNWDGTGNVGWHINKSGYATFNGVTVRGTIYATNGEFRGTVYATNGEFRGTVYATDGDFQGTVYANKIVGNISESKMYPGFSQARPNSNTMTINYAGNPRLPVRVSIFFTINGYSAGTRFWVNGEEQTDRSPGKSYGFSFDVGTGAGLTITLRASGEGSISTSPIIAIVTPQGTGLS